MSKIALLTRREVGRIEQFPYKTIAKYSSKMAAGGTPRDQANVFQLPTIGAIRPKSIAAARAIIATPRRIVSRMKK